MFWVAHSSLLIVMESHQILTSLLGKNYQRSMARARVDMVAVIKWRPSSMYVLVTVRARSKMNGSRVPFQDCASYSLGSIRAL